MPTPTPTPIAETGEPVFSLFWLASVIAAGIVGAVLRSLHPIRMMRSWRLARKARKLADEIETLIDGRAATTPPAAPPGHGGNRERNQYLSETMRLYADQGLARRVAEFAEELEREDARVRFQPKKATLPSYLRTNVVPELRKISKMKRLVP